MTFVDQTLSETNRKNTIDLVTTMNALCLKSDWNFTLSKLTCFLGGLQIGTGHPRPSSEDDMESPFPKELTLQQVRLHALTSLGLHSPRWQGH